MKSISSLMTELWGHTLFDVMSKIDDVISPSEMSVSFWNFADFLTMLHTCIAITSVKFCEIYPSRNAFLEITLFSIRQLPMTSVFLRRIMKNLVKKIVECKISKANLTTCEFTFSYQIEKCNFWRCLKEGSGTPHKSVSPR